MAGPRDAIPSAAVASLVVCAVVGGCRNSPPPGNLAVLVSGDTSGWITPCGCASNQSGGLPRRGDLIRRSRADRELLVVDVGGAPGGTSPYDRLKFEAILRGERAMGLKAHNIGRAEAALGPETLRDLQRKTGVEWLSANVKDRSGQPIGRPVQVVECQGRRIALVGVLDPALAGPNVSVAPVVASVLEALESVKGSYDSAIVLAYLEERPLREAAASLPEVDVIVGGPTGQSIPPVRIGPTLLTSATNMGKFVARLDAPPAGEKWQASIIELDGSFADDPLQMENVRHYRSELAKRSFSPRETSFVPPGGAAGSGEVAGSKRCESCHPDPYKSWFDSAHARAWESLERKSAHVDPDCQRCHTTGYGVRGGYAGLGTKADRIGVGCESCHGPSLAHVLKADSPTGWAQRAADSCLACHDLENSPLFDYDVYWSRIAHGDACTNTSPEQANP